MPVSSLLLFLRRSSSAVVLLVALAVAASACSSDPEIEADDTSSTLAPTDTDDSDADGSDDAEMVETETDAMGEDDDDPTAGTIADDDETDPDDPDNGSTQTTAAPSLDSPDLAAALEAGQSDAFTLPFMYITADQDCDGCAETVSLYYVPGAEKASILDLEAAFVDGNQVDVSQVDPSLSAGDPRLIAERLAAADDADYSIDVVSGLVTQWTLDGDTVTLRCLQVDTRPIDLRDVVCRDSLIG